MITVLVTGASGFVGSHVLDALNRRDNVRVIAACRDPKRLLNGYQGEVRQGDFRNPEYVNELMQDVDVLCQCAAWSSLWGNTENSKNLFLQPILGVIEQAHKSGVKRIVNISTTSAAAPEHSSDPMSEGIQRSLWPHLCNVVKIENYMREHAGEHCTMINLRAGIFAGTRYALGILPILLPRLKTHLVPWVSGGRTSLPITDGRDIGEAFALASLAPDLKGYQGFNIVGSQVPTVRDVIDFIHDEFDYPTPHFSVPFVIAYPFARLMELLDPFVPWEPLVTRSIIHLMEEVDADNHRATALLGYQPQYHWKESVRSQIEEMHVRQKVPMKMAMPVV